MASTITISSSAILMTSTSSLLLERNQAFSWRIAPDLKQYEKRLRELMSIVEKFAASNDILSRRLHRHAARMISKPVVDLKTSLSNAEKFLNTLCKRILVNPLKENISLQSPLVDGEHTWDEWSLKEFQSMTKSSLSPYDSKPINAKPHLFALEMIAWIHTFIESPNFSIRHTLLPSNYTPGELTPETQKRHFTYYRNLAQEYLTDKNVKEVLFKTKRMEKELEESSLVAERFVQEEEKIIQVHLNTLFRTFEEGLAAKSAEHKIDMDRIERKQKELDEKQTELEREKEIMKKQVEEQATQLRHLSNELALRRAELAALAAQKGDGGCCIL